MLTGPRGGGGGGGGGGGRGGEEEEPLFNIAIHPPPYKLGNLGRFQSKHQTCHSKTRVAQLTE
jgi:hypothetical protein